MFKRKYIFYAILYTVIKIKSVSIASCNLKCKPTLGKPERQHRYRGYGLRLCQKRCLGALED